MKNEIIECSYQNIKSELKIMFSVKCSYRNKLDYAQHFHKGLHKPITIWITRIILIYYNVVNRLN